LDSNPSRTLCHRSQAGGGYRSDTYGHEFGMGAILTVFHPQAQGQKAPLANIEALSTIHILANIAPDPTFSGRRLSRGLTTESPVRLVSPQSRRRMCNLISAQQTRHLYCVHVHLDWWTSVLVDLRLTSSSPQCNQPTTRAIL